MGLCGATEASFQLNMIGQGDVCAKWRSPDLRQYDLFPNYGYLARMCWSKNVREERDAPLQLVLGGIVLLPMLLSGPNSTMRLTPT